MQPIGLGAIRQPGSVGGAYLDLLVNASNVPRDTQRALDQISKDSDKMTKKAGTQLGKSLGENMSDEIQRPSWWQRLQRAFTRAFSRRRVSVPIDIDVNQNRSQIAAAGTVIGRTLSRSIGNAMSSSAQSAFSGFLNTLASGVSSIGASIGNVGSRGPLGLLVGVGIIAGIPALVGAIASLLAVFAPLVNIILLLPSAIAVLVAAILPLVVAFQGMGTAIAAVISGDPEQIAEAFKGISKSAGIFLSKMGPLLEWFKALKSLTQEAFFKELAKINIFGFLVQQIGPEVITGFERIARAAGNFAIQLITVAAHPAVQKFLQVLFNTTANVFTALGPGITSLIQGLANLGTVSLPYIEKGVKAISDMLASLGNWMSEISKDGRFREFMDKLERAIGDLKALASSGWNLIKAIVGGTNEEDRAHGFLDKLIQTIDDLTYFFESDIGQLAIQGMITMAEIFLFFLLGIIAAWALMGVMVEGIRIGIRELINGIESFYRWVVKTVDKLNIFKSGWSFLTGFANGGKGFATGGIVTSPTLAMIGEGGGSEVVIPLNDPNRAHELMQQSGLLNLAGNSGGGNSGIVFGAGAIQVNFMGAVPSEEEAYRTGAAVERGIADQLARRNTRLAVRTR